jgi:hypothetical protein
VYGVLFIHRADLSSAVTDEAAAGSGRSNGPAVVARVISASVVGIHVGVCFASYELRGNESLVVGIGGLLFVFEGRTAAETSGIIFAVPWSRDGHGARWACQLL